MKRFITVVASLAFLATSTSAFACSDPNCKGCKDDTAKTQTVAPTPAPAPAPAPAPQADPQH